MNQRYKRRKYGSKKAFITFAKPFEMNWDEFHKAPHLIFTLHNKHLKARGHKVTDPKDMSLEKRRRAPEQ